MSMMINCKVCHERMSSVEWMTKNNCCEPNCKCPGVQKLAAKAQAVISDAKSGNKVSIQVTRGAVPHGYQYQTEQQVMKCNDVKVIEIKPTFGRRK